MQLIRWAVTIFVVGFCLFIVISANADGVKHCKDLTTGEVFVVEENYPCPGNTVKI